MPVLPPLESAYRDRLSEDKLDKIQQLVDGRKLPSALNGLRRRGSRVLRGPAKVRRPSGIDMKKNPFCVPKLVLTKLKQRPTRLPPVSCILQKFNKEKLQERSRHLQALQKQAIELARPTVIDYIRENIPSAQQEEPGVDLIETLVNTGPSKLGNVYVPLKFRFPPIALAAVACVKFKKRLRSRRQAIVLDALAAIHQNKLTTSPIPTELMVGLIQGFRALDVDGSGQVSFKELHNASLKLNRTPVDTSLFKRIDKDKSGTVDHHELLRVLYPCIPRRLLEASLREAMTPKIEASWEQCFPPEVLHEIAAIYSHLTDGGKCSLTFEKFILQAPCEGVTTEEVRQQFDEADTDKDGCLSFKEYAAFMRQSFVSLCDD